MFGGLVGFALSGVACSGSTETYTSDADRGSTHAIVTVERRTVMETSEVQTRAFASFLRTPPEVDIAQVTRAAGLELSLPEVGDCTTGAINGETALAPGAFRGVELLSVGRVSLETTAGRVELAPRAFPAVTDLSDGVVYTSRDRAAALPAGEPYAITAAGAAGGIPRLNVSIEAPAALEGISVAGVALGADSLLPAGGAELAWKPGSARDLIYVTLSPAGGALASVCAFRDDAGKGSLPASAIPSGASAALSLHRLRTVPLTSNPSSGLDAGKLRFDFEVAASLPIVDR